MDFVGHAQHFSEILTVHCARGDLTLREGEILDRPRWLARNDIRLCSRTAIRSSPFWIRCGRELGTSHRRSALPVFDFTQAIFASARSGAGHAVGRLRRREVHGRPAVRTMLFVALFSREKSTKISSAPVSGRSPSAARDSEGIKQVGGCGLEVVVDADPQHGARPSGNDGPQASPSIFSGHLLPERPKRG